jgi:ABC-type glycerol-3-phosphate transport system substrate-binding protein
VRVFFASAFVALALLTVVAWSIQPRESESGKVPLVWVSDDNPTRREQIALFNRLHPDIDLRLDPNNGGLEKVIVQSLAGVGPDLFDAFDGSALSAYVKSGIAWDVTDELTKAGIDVPNGVWSAMQPKVVYEGRVYGCPTNGAVNAVWVNRDIFDKAGAPYPKGPWHWRDFLPLAKKLTVRDKNGRIVQFGFLFDWWNWQHFLIQWGGRIYTEDGTRCIVDSPEAVAAVQFMYDLTYKYHVSPTPLDEAGMATQGGWGSGTISWFGAGRAAMALGGRWWLCTLRGYNDVHLAAVESPYEKFRAFTTVGRGTLINKNSPRRREALEFLKFEASQEYNDLINSQADGVAPVIRYCYTDRFLRDPKHLEESFNAVWRDAMNHAVPDQVSPFINGQVASRIISNQLDLVKNNQKPAPQAMRDAAKQINAEIAATIERDPSLRERFRKLTAVDSR